MKFFTITVLAAAAGIATASPTLRRRNNDDNTNKEVELTALPASMKSIPECQRWRYYCVTCDVNDLNCVTNPSCEWCTLNDPSWDGTVSGYEPVH